MENTDLPLYIINSKIMKYYIINNVAYRCRHRLNSYTLINISHDNSPNSNICILHSLKQETYHSKRLYSPRPPHYYYKIIPNLYRTRKLRHWRRNRVSDPRLLQENTSITQDEIYESRHHGNPTISEL